MSTYKKKNAIVQSEIERRRELSRANVRKANLRFYMRSSTSVFRYIFIFILCLNCFFPFFYLTFLFIFYGFAVYI